MLEAPRPGLSHRWFVPLQRFTMTNSERAFDVTVVGAGLAGCEAAFQLAERGLRVRLFEMKPTKRTPAQTSDFFAELVCSNSLRGAALANAVGLLKEELRRCGSLLMRVADLTAVPAGGALAVDREKFGEEMTRAMREHPRIVVEARGWRAALGVLRRDRADRCGRLDRLDEGVETVALGQRSGRA